MIDVDYLRTLKMSDEEIIAALVEHDRMSETSARAWLARLDEGSTDGPWVDLVSEDGPSDQPIVQ